MNSFEKWRDRVLPEDAQGVLDTIARAVAEHAGRFSFRYRMRALDGSQRSVEGSARCFYDAEGNLTRTIGSLVDMTERDTREADLIASEAQMRSILATVPDAMVMIDARGQIAEFGKAAEELWGYAPGEVLGQQFTVLFPEENRDLYLKEGRRYSEGAAPSVLDNVQQGTGMAKSGDRFPIEIRVGKSGSGSATRFILFVRDITDREATQARLADLNSELAHVSRQSAMSELAADLAHELNQPLAATTNFLSAARLMIQRGDAGERVAELLRMGAEQTLRAGEIIRRLREFMAKREVDMRAERIDGLVRDAVELVLVGTGRFDIRLSYEFDPDAPLILADRIQVQQVLVNLLRNAIHVLRDQKSGERIITVRSRGLSSDLVEIEVADTGPGIPEELLRHLYTRFTTTKGEGGMGIGLSICKRIIEAHGGTLTAENRQEGGASFRFTVPALEGVET